MLAPHLALTAAAGTVLLTALLALMFAPAKLPATERVAAASYRVQMANYAFAPAAPATSSPPRQTSPIHAAVDKPQSSTVPSPPAHAAGHVAAPLLLSGLTAAIAMFCLLLIASRAATAQATPTPATSERPAVPLRLPVGPSAERTLAARDAAPNDRPFIRS